MPSSITSTVSNHSAIETRTLVCDARVLGDVRERLGAHEIGGCLRFRAEAPVGKRPREGGTSPLGELTQPLGEPALGEKRRMNASRQLTELDARSRDLERELGIDPSRELGDPVERPARADRRSASRRRRCSSAAATIRRRDASTSATRWRTSACRRAFATASRVAAATADISAASSSSAGS